MLSSKTELLSREPCSLSLKAKFASGSESLFISIFIITLGANLCPGTLLYLAMNDLPLGRLMRLGVALLTMT